MSKLTLIGSTGTYLNLKSSENTPFVYVKKIDNPEVNTAEGAHFGSSLAMNSRWIVIGAPLYPYRGSGTINYSGKVYIYDAQTFEYVTSFQNTSYSSFTITNNFDNFGAALSIVDGTTYDYIFVGVPGLQAAGQSYRYGGTWKYQIRNSGGTRGTVTRVDTSTRGLGAYVLSSPATTWMGATNATDGTYLFQGNRPNNTSELFRIQVHRVSDLNFLGAYAATSTNIDFGYSASKLDGGYTGGMGGIVVKPNSPKAMVTAIDTTVDGTPDPGLVFNYTTPSGLTQSSSYDYKLADPASIGNSSYSFAFGGTNNSHLFAARTDTSQLTAYETSDYTSVWTSNYPALYDGDDDQTNNKFGQCVVADENYVISSMMRSKLSGGSSDVYGGAFVFDINSGKVLQKIKNPDADGNTRYFGVSMAYNNDQLLIADRFGSSTTGRKGAVYVYKRTR